MRHFATINLKFRPRGGATGKVTASQGHSDSSSWEHECLQNMAIQYLLRY